MNDLRTAAQRALEALNKLYLPGELERVNAAITALRAALAQQDEPAAVAERERIAAQWDGCVTHQLDAFGPVDIGASIRAGELVEPAQQAEPVSADPHTTTLRNLLECCLSWERDACVLGTVTARQAVAALRAALAQQDEPLNLRDPAVQKRLATQWGYVPAAQAEPVGEILPNWSTEQERIVGTWAYLNDLGTNLPVGTKLYTAPPQRKLVPLTEAEIEHIGITHQSLRQVARAVERAVWEKNNG